MNRGPNSPVMSFCAGATPLYAAAMGGGAAADCTVASNGALTDASGLYPKAVNFASSVAYNAATGKYIATLSESVKHILFASGIVVDSGASPTAALVVVVTAIVASTKKIYFNVYTPAGVLTDLGTSDMVILKVDAANTSSIG
jgi:hypothetical protein